MRKIIFFFFLFQMIFTVRVHSGEIREIEMTDGSVIQAEVVSLAGGIYTVKSDALGTIKLEESKIRSIRSGQHGNGPKSGSAKEIAALQERMMSDKEIMSLIQSLKNDPDFKKILEDPEMMSAVNSGDMAALIANPQFLKLLNNATVQDIQKKVK